MKAFCLGFVMLFLVVSIGFAQQWPSGSWQEAIIATTDDVHKAEAGVQWNGDKLTIKAGGDDIWGNADQFTFVYKEVSGDFDVAITVDSLENTHDWEKRDS